MQSAFAMLLIHCYASLLFLGLFLPEIASKANDKVPVSLKDKWRGRCRDLKKNSYKRRQYLEAGCYRYTCTRRGRFVTWSRSHLSEKCCFVDSKGYGNGSIVSNITSKDDCVQKIQFCSVNEQGAGITTSIKPLCCLVMGKLYTIGTNIEYGCSKK